MVTVKEQEFDMVFDCQKVFKDIMNALARPGQVFSIRNSVEKLEVEHQTLTAVALTLLDNRCKYFTNGTQEWSDVIREKTMSLPSSPENADFFLISKQEAGGCELLGKGKAGSLAEPHKSALFLVELESLEGEEDLRLKGPGIKEEIQVMLSATGRKWIEEREKQEYEYPCGIDIIFCTPEGSLMGIPRTVMVGGGKKWDM